MGKDEAPACAHSRLENVRGEERLPKGDSFLFKLEIGRGDCADCGKVNICIEHWTFAPTGWRYPWTAVDARKCPHEYWNVVDGTREDATERSISGTVAALANGMMADDLRFSHFAKAVAECKRCGSKYRVRSDYAEPWHEHPEDIPVKKW